MIYHLLIYVKSKKSEVLLVMHTHSFSEILMHTLLTKDYAVAISVFLKTHRFKQYVNSFEGFVSMSYNNLHT